MQSSDISKLVAGAATVVVLSLAVGGSSLYVNHTLGNQLDRAVNEIARRQILAGQISTEAADLVALERALAFGTVLQQSEHVESSKTAYGQAEDRAKKHMQEFRELLAVTDRGGIEQLSADFDEARKQHAEMLSLLQQQKMDVAISMLNTSVIPKLGRVSDSAKKLVTSESAELERVRSDSDTQRAYSFWTVLALNLIALAVGGSLFWLAHRLRVSLRGSVHNLTEGATQLASAAAQVSTASLSLSQVASEQAASLEETSASTEEIHSMTRRNAENANSAAERTQEAYATIQQANRALELMVASMQEISDSSGKISKIIKVIDEIAFQTNILALNAAVEAARAGEAGMGFAVVADEVRNLAQRSAAAAKDTAGLIEESITRSDEGRHKLDEVARAITSITESSQKVKTLVEEVREGSQQQERGIEQIARAVSQMEAVTQKVAANAEQGAAAGQQLDGQSKSVDKVVRALQLMVGSIAEAAPASPKANVTLAEKPRPIASSRTATPPIPERKGQVATAVMAPQKAEDMIPLDDDFKMF